METLTKCVPWSLRGFLMAAALLSMTLMTVSLAKPPSDRDSGGKKPIPTQKVDQETLLDALQIRDLRKEIAQVTELTRTPPKGWSISPLDPTKVVAKFPQLKVDRKHRLRVYQFYEGGNGNGFVWAMPANQPLPNPGDCPRLQTHFLQPPKPPAALDDFMDAVTGDGSPNSYLSASLMARELRELGAMWHGLDWSTHVVLDADPWKFPQPEDENRIAPMDRPEGDPKAWTWKEQRPTDWKPRVEITPSAIRVTFYTFSGKGEQTISRHVDTYKPGSYRCTTSVKAIATGEGGFMF